MTTTKPTTYYVIGAILLILVIVAVFAIARRARTARLQRHFGLEYDRVARESGSQAAAESERVRREDGSVARRPAALPFILQRTPWRSSDGFDRRRPSVGCFKALTPTWIFQGPPEFSLCLRV
jgi:hypothetical protein